VGVIEYHMGFFGSEGRVAIGRYRTIARSIAERVLEADGDRQGLGTL